MLATAPGLRRTPFAPLDLQLSMNKDIDMSNEDAFQAPRKSSITLTNATRPTPYVQRNLPRRYTQGQRRTSLPALHHSYESGLTPPTPMPTTATAVSHPDYIHDDENDIYSRLSTFTFGDAQPSQFQLVASSSRAPDDVLMDNLSPLDKTPRPSVAYSAGRKLSSVSANKDKSGWSSPSSDEEERRRSTRAKMRAIDDGTRRPSLPTNDIQHASSSGSLDKGKGRETEHKKAQQPASPSEVELDTDVDLLSASADDTERHRRDMHSHDTSRSDLGSVFGHEEEMETNVESGGEKTDEADVQRKDSAQTWTESTMNRRGSLPMDIPTSSRSSHVHHPYHDDIGNNSYSPEFDARARAQAQLRRPSRSVDDDLQRAARNLQRKASHVSATASVSTGSGHGSLGMESSLGGGPSSEPDMRGVAMAQAIAQAHLDAQQQAESTNPSINDNDEPYQGLDLNYILAGTGGSGVGLNKSGNDSWSGRLSVGSSIVASREQREREREPSWAANWNIASGRRQSTATVNDDTFLRFVKRHDLSYDERKREWTFMRERADTDNWPKPGQEIWRCLWVGRYRVDRVHSKNADPSKPLQVRLNIRHLPDPYSKAGNHGGPLTFIHKHSRAQAFSIFRGHQLPQRHLKTSSSILLAPKKVQEQFTSTRTTSKLSTHGLLEDTGTGTVGSISTTGTASGTGRSQQTASGSGTNSATTSTTSVSSSRGASTSMTSNSKKSSSEMSPTIQNKSSMLRLKVDREREKYMENPTDRKGKGVIRSPIATESPGVKAFSGELASPGTNNSDLEKPHSHPSTVASMEGSNRPISSIAETASFVSEGSQQFSSAVSAWDQSSTASSQRDSLWSAHPRGMDLLYQLQTAKMNAAARGSVGSLEDTPIRTSHAEAFATLDPPFIEYLRNHSTNYDGASEHDSQPSRFRGLRKLFHPQPQRNTPKHSPQGPPANATVLEGHYTPPWLTMAARSKQEEQERVIKNLNASFRDVGLLPTFKPSRNRETKKGKRNSENVFDQIPDDALYMLLPMWPGETDPNSITEEYLDFEVPLHERQYLLVYYVPNELDKKKSDEKKRMRSQTPSGSSLHSEASTARLSKNIVSLTSFNVLARLVSYKDVNGSGIRVPTSGLSVSGPMEDAVRAIPQIRFQVDDLALIIAFCASRDRGVEVVPEGVEKLGLCLPRTSPDPDSDAPLSSLGRAAVEMAWLGALAVMGFGNVA